jgi:hypothetical protein
MAALDTITATAALPLADLAGALDPADGLGDTAQTGPGQVFVMANGSGVTRTATIATPGTHKGMAIADGQLVVPAGDIGLIPLTGIFRGANSRAAITYDNAVGLTVGVFHIGG